MIQITLPVPLEQIKTELKRLYDELDRLQLEMKSISAMIAAVMECCPHTKISSGEDYGGYKNTKCDHCGKGW